MKLFWGIEKYFHSGYITNSVQIHLDIRQCSLLGDFFFNIMSSSNKIYWEELLHYSKTKAKV